MSDDVIESPEEKRARLLAELRELDAVHPVAKVEGDEQEPEPVPEHALSGLYKGVSLGTWLERLRYIFQTNFHNDPGAHAAVHVPPEE